MPSSATVPTVSARQLAGLLEAGGDLQLLDVRAPAAVAAGRIDLVPAHRFHNIPGSDLLQRRSLRDAGIEPTAAIVVVCSHGHDSRVVAAHLNDIGHTAASLDGGMAAWMDLVVERTAPAPRSLDHFVQFDRPGKRALGYLLVSDGQALIVDPPRDAAPYLEAARAAAARVIGVADTHLHADYVSGAPAIARELAVPYYLHAADAVSPYDGTPGRLAFRAIADGDVLRVGRSSIRVLHTPGHTEGSVCYTVDDDAVLTGDFVFVASAGRPDLAGRTAEWTSDLWQSVRTVKRAWRPAMTIYPAHYASNHERRRDGVVAASFGRLLGENEALRFDAQARFFDWVTAHTGSFPDAYRRIKEINLGLVTADATLIAELEAGPNRCALGSR